MEYKHEITFRTFRNYCKYKEKQNRYLSLCGKTKTLRPSVVIQWCEKKNCPLFKKLKRAGLCSGCKGEFDV